MSIVKLGINTTPVWKAVFDTAGQRNDARLNFACKDSFGIRAAFQLFRPKPLQTVRVSALGYCCRRNPSGVGLEILKV